MTKKEKQIYRKGIADTLLSIAAAGTWIVMFITYSYIKFFRR